MEDNSLKQYQEQLAVFTARKLPQFYEKYGKEPIIQKHPDVSSQLREQDMFPKALPIEKLLDIPAAIRKRRFFEAISVGDIVDGRVNSKWADTLFIKLDSVYRGPNRWIRDLKIKAECNLSEFKTHSGSRRLSDSITDFDIGDHVRGVVTTIDRKDWKLMMSFRRSSLPDHLSHTELGAVDDPASTEMDKDDDLPYLEHLEMLPSFSNPEIANNLLLHLGIDTKRPGTFLECVAQEVPSDEFGEKLRERQSTKWSMEMVASGVKLFKEKKNDEALRCFDQALQMHPSNVEALVARGALRANQGMLKSAINDFRQALDVHPLHRNGRKYLCETLVSVAKRYEKDRDWKEASRRYKEVLEIDANHDEARERVHQIRMMMSQQVLAGKRHPPFEPAKRRDITATERPIQERSDSLLELLKRKTSKKIKKPKKSKKTKTKKKAKKKTRKRRSRTSSESSQSSDDDSEVTESASEKPSSDDSEVEWVEKTVPTSHVDHSNVTKRDSSRAAESSGSKKRKYSIEKSIGKESTRKQSEDSDHKNDHFRPPENVSQQCGSARRLSSENNTVNIATRSSDIYRANTNDESVIDTSSSRYCQSKNLSKMAAGRRFSSDEINFISNLLSKKPKNE